MKKIVYILLITFSFLHSVEIDEHKVDLYYANGIMMQDTKSQAQIKWSIRVGDLLSSNPELFNRIGKVDVAYNISKGMASDLFETFIQKTKLEVGYSISWSAFKFFLRRIPKIGKALPQLARAAEYATQTIHDGTLNTQIENYKDSIKSGHGVVVVAHGQGNLFTQEAYRDLIAKSKEGWMGNYFHVISVATPGSEIANNGNGVIFHNDFITLIPGGMKSNIVSNPNTYDEYIYNALNELIGIDKDLKSKAYHGFEYYLGYPVLETMIYTRLGASSDAVRTTKVSTSKAQTLIMDWIVDEINVHKSRPSQWKAKEDEKLCKTKTCENTPIELTHQFDPKNMDKTLNNALIYPFNTENGKLYQIDSKYVMASFGGETLVYKPEKGICYKIIETYESIEGNERNLSYESFKPESGVIETTLGWNYELDIDMNLEFKAPRNIAIHDGKDIKNLGIEHAYIKSQFDTRPGDLYELHATGNKLAESELDETCLDTEPVNIYAIVKTPSGSYFKQYEAKNFAELNIKRYAEIEVEEKISTIWLCPAIEKRPGWFNKYNQDLGIFQCIECQEPYSLVYSPPLFKVVNDVYTKIKPGNWFCNKPLIESTGLRDAVRIYDDTCKDEEKKESCGCVPCEYIVRGMENAIEYGPIAGASIQIVDAQHYGNTDAEVIYRGITTTHRDMLKAGLVELTNSDKEKFQNEHYYVISAKGGNDLDRNDDLIRDDIPTVNNGTIHAIIKGSDLKLLSFRVNVLTEAIFQVSGGVIGSNYNATQLAEKLDDTAEKLLKEKLYPTDSTMQIRY